MNKISESINLIENSYYRQNIKFEIEELNKEISSIDIEPFPLDKYDYYAVFIIALLEVGLDVLIGNNISNVNSEFNNYLNEIHDKSKYFDHSGQPIDFQGKIRIDKNGAHIYNNNSELLLDGKYSNTNDEGTLSWGGGNQRARTYSHDLLAFPLTIYMLFKGEFIDGGYINGKYFPIITSFNQNLKQYKDLPIESAIIAYLIHMSADFLSKKSIPIPGLGILSHIPVREVRIIIQEIYNNGFNLKNTVSQGFPILSTELLMRIYFNIRYRNYNASAQSKTLKLNQLLQLSHSLALMVNIGKVVFTSSPALLNLPMICRVISLTWEIIKSNSVISNNSITKGNLQALKMQLQILDCYLLLDDGVKLVESCEHFNKTKKISIEKNIDQIKENRDKNIIFLKNQLK